MNVIETPNRRKWSCERFEANIDLQTKAQYSVMTSKLAATICGHQSTQTHPNPSPMLLPIMNMIETPFHSLVAKKASSDTKPNVESSSKNA